MKALGFFTFVLVLLFVLATIEFSRMSLAQQNVIGETNNYLLQMEEAEFVRETIEINTDRVFGNTLHKEISECLGGEAGKSGDDVRAALAKNLAGLFAKYGEEYRETPRVEFFAGGQRLAGTQAEELLKQKLDAVVKVIKAEVNGAIEIKEIWATGRVRDSPGEIYAVIDFPDYSQKFLLPNGYEQTRHVVKSGVSCLVNAVVS